MNKAKELTKIKSIVKVVLKGNVQARNSDMALYVKVCELINPLALDKPFWYVLMNLKDFNLPNFETVRRTRQKLQETCPELAGDPNVETQRVINEEAFRSFARGMA